MTFFPLRRKRNEKAGSDHVEGVPLGLPVLAAGALFNHIFDTGLAAAPMRAV
jgi:hypothetical protein